MLSLTGGKIKNFSMFVLKENQYFHKVVCEKKQAGSLSTVGIVWSGRLYTQCWRRRGEDYNNRILKNR